LVKLVVVNIIHSHHTHLFRHQISRLVILPSLIIACLISLFDLFLSFLSRWHLICLTFSWLLLILSSIVLLIVCRVHRHLTTLHGNLTPIVLLIVSRLILVVLRIVIIIVILMLLLLLISWHCLLSLTYISTGFRVNLRWLLLSFSCWHWLIGLRLLMLWVRLLRVTLIVLRILVIVVMILLLLLFITSFYRGALSWRLPVVVSLRIILGLSRMITRLRIMLLLLFLLSLLLLFIVLLTSSDYIIFFNIFSYLTFLFCVSAGISLILIVILRPAS
jgi:hypothetical protein